MAEGRMESVKTGYLNESFRLFHLRDQVSREFSFHYHDFYKIVVFLEGKADYHIEGRTYPLSPWDILLVDRYAIHKPEIDASLPYERYVLWIREDLEEPKLLTCFSEGKKKDSILLKASPEEQKRLARLLRELEKEMQGEAAERFGTELLSRSVFCQFMVWINRMTLDTGRVGENKTYHSDDQIEQLLRYINTHLTDDLSADALAGRYYMSKYHLMRRFKEETGYTLHQYVLSKRLIKGRSLIAEGMPVVKASSECGFGDYTTFARAYRKQFGNTPGEARYLALPETEENEE